MTFGQEHAKTDGHPEDRFGRQLAVVKDMNVGPCMDAVATENWLYAIGEGKLFVADISEPVAPKVVGAASGFGNTRQIEIKDEVAYITAREDGLFIVDVSRAEAPRLLCHYDTIELATGIAVSGDIAFVACRTYGVELVDVSDPRRPVHLSTVRTGEAQSCIARDGVLYVGVWGTRELVICDVKNPREPVVIARAPLDGYGDGVDVRGKYCYVATGHHARGMKKSNDETDPAYGRGHGLEIFDVAEPSKPIWISRIKMPRFVLTLSMDLWGVTVEGNYAFVADTFNGVFVVDVSDAREPFFVGHRWWKYDPKRDWRMGSVGGLALGSDHIYVAGAGSDLHVLHAPGLAAPLTPEPDDPPSIPPSKRAPEPRFHVYDPGGQVHAVAFSGDVAIVAAGAAGVHEARIWPKIEKLCEYETVGFAKDVEVLGNRVFVAEGKGGLSIWERGRDGLLAQVGCYRVPSYAVQQVVVPPPGKYALLHVGPNALHIVDVSEPAQPRLLLRDVHAGLMYGYNIAEGLLDGRYACCGWNYSSGCYWYDLYGGPRPTSSGDSHEICLYDRDGMALVDERALVIHRGKYLLLDRTDTRPVEDLTTYGIPGHALCGKPSIYGTRLYVCNRILGKVSVVDISNLDEPKLLRSFQLRGNPGIAVEHKDTLVIPAGYQGLLIDAGQGGGLRK